MKALKIIIQLVKWILITGIILFTLSLFLNKSYAQTTLFLLMAVSLAWWPKIISKRWNRKIATISRISFLFVLVLIKVIFLQGKPKTTIYTLKENRETLMAIYDECSYYWPKDTEDIFIETEYGKVHVLACGKKNNPPILLFHAASMGAHSWAETLPPLLENYRIYAVDNICEGNKSQLNDALNYPNTQKEIADLYAFIAESLGIKRSPVFGASNGGFIAQVYTYYYPEKVESLALFGPMGLTQLSGKSIFMLSAASLYPLQAVRNSVTKWAIGNDEYVNRKYGDWFNQIMKATIPSVAMPVPMKTLQKQQMDLPVLLFLGTKDAIVGDADIAKQAALDYPNIQIEILDSGHLISVEKADFVNATITEFLHLN